MDVLHLIIANIYMEIWGQQVDPHRAAKDPVLALFGTISEKCRDDFAFSVAIAISQNKSHIFSWRYTFFLTNMQRQIYMWRVILIKIWQQQVDPQKRSNAKDSSKGPTWTDQ